MSIVVYKDGILACDSQADQGGCIVPGGANKVYRSNLHDTTFAFTGCLPLFDPIVEWYLIPGRDPKEIPKMVNDPANESVSVMWIFSKKSFSKLNTSVPYPLKLDHTVYHAMGSGMEIALGALHSGASPEEAVLAAISHDTGCGGPVKIYNLSEMGFCA